MPSLIRNSTVFPGFSSIEFNYAKLPALLHMFQSYGYHYGFGCKPEDLAGMPPKCIDYLGKFGPAGAEVERLDCSAFHRYCMFHATEDNLVLPDGSTAQNDWYAANDFKHHKPNDDNDYIQMISNGKGNLYACFCHQGDRREEIGHVWYVYHDMRGRAYTYESHGGLGPDSRAFDYPTLAHICTDLYPIANIGL